MTAPQALVIVPTYNERENLPALIDELLRHPNVRVMVISPPPVGGMPVPARPGPAVTLRGLFRVFPVAGCPSPEWPE